MVSVGIVVSRAIMSLILILHTGVGAGFVGFGGSVGR